MGELGPRTLFARTPPCPDMGLLGVRGLLRTSQPRVSTEKDAGSTAVSPMRSFFEASDLRLGASGQWEPGSWGSREDLFADPCFLEILSSGVIVVLEARALVRGFLALIPRCRLLAIVDPVGRRRSGDTCSSGLPQRLVRIVRCPSSRLAISFVEFSDHHHSLESDPRPPTSVQMKRGRDSSSDYSRRTLGAGRQRTLNTEALASTTTPALEETAILLRHSDDSDATTLNSAPPKRKVARDHEMVLAKEKRSPLSISFLKGPVQFWSGRTPDTSKRSLGGGEAKGRGDPHGGLAKVDASLVASFYPRPRAKRGRIAARGPGACFVGRWAVWARFACRCVIAPPKGVAADVAGVTGPVRPSGGLVVLTSGSWSLPPAPI